MLRAIRTSCSLAVRPSGSRGVWGGLEQHQCFGVCIVEVHRWVHRVGYIAVAGHGCACFMFGLWVRGYGLRCVYSTGDVMLGGGGGGRGMCVL